MATGYFTSSSASGAPPLPTAQELADRVAAEARAAMPRPLFRPPPPRPQPLAQTNDVGLLRIAEEIGMLQRTVEAVGDRLSDDAAIALRHGTLLQQFDIIAQTLGHLERVVATEDRLCAMDRIGMGALKARLLRGIGTPCAANSNDGSGQAG